MGGGHTEEKKEKKEKKEKGEISPHDLCVKALWATAQKKEERSRKRTRTKDVQ